MITGRRGATTVDAASRSFRRLPPGGLLLVFAALALLMALTAWGEYDSGRFRVALDLPVALLALALVPLMLRRPVIAAVLLAALALLSPLAAPVGPTAVLQVAQRRRFTVALAVGALSAAGHVVRYAWRPTEGMSFLWWCGLVVAAHAALVGWGAWWQARVDLVASLRDRAERAEAEQGRRVAEARALERRQMAAEMHDVLAHRLSLLATYAGALQYRPDASPDQLARAAGVVRSGVHEALDELRQVITVLRDDSPDSAPDRPQPRLADVPELVHESEAAGLVVVLQLPAWDDEPAGPVARAAYRVVQEGLTNARRHAPGSPVRVRLAREDGLLLVDVTNPVHAQPPPSPGSGTGLVGLTERVQLAGGRLDHGVRAGTFTLHASLPWAP
jgi:signal transduction histidine kinase